MEREGRNIKRKKEEKIKKMDRNVDEKRNWKNQGRKRDKRESNYQLSGRKKRRKEREKGGAGRRKKE